MSSNLDFLPPERPYTVAEIGGNHGGDVEQALEYATAAAEAGADAAKFQLYQAEHLIVEDEPPLPLAGDDYDTQFERFKELELTPEEWLEVIGHCRDEGIDFAASVFDEQMLEFAADHISFVKIASGDLTNLPLLRKAASTDLPIVLSTGFSTIDEIETVVEELPETELVLLHCIGSYPTADRDVNLEMIKTLAETFDVPVGYSDHTVDTLAPVTAAALGARILEKHFTLDKIKEVGDHRLSATPEEMGEIVSESARAFQARGEPRGKNIYECEGNIRENMRRSLATTQLLEEGQELTAGDLTTLRPATGISPLYYDDILGSILRRDVDENQVLTRTDIESSL
jgi:sialic acid synthase SpsE